MATFKELYEAQKAQPTPAAAFITKVAELTHRTENTVRMWLMGVQTPDDLVIAILADFFGTKPDELFPTRTSK